jgi:hypothetical protein
LIGWRNKKQKTKNKKLFRGDCEYLIDWELQSMRVRCSVREGGRSEMGERVVVLRDREGL